MNHTNAVRFHVTGSQRLKSIIRAAQNVLEKAS